MPQKVRCCIVNEYQQPVYRALIVIDNAPIQLQGYCFEITVGKHYVKVMHKDYPTEEGLLNVTIDFNIVLGGGPSLLA